MTMATRTRAIFVGARGAFRARGRDGGGGWLLRGADVSVVAPVAAGAARRHLPGIERSGRDRASRVPIYPTVVGAVRVA